ncbi:MAG: DUF3866 family protein [Acidimicrobiia bacterium]
MVAFHTRSVVEIIEERDGLQRVRLDDDTRAYALTNLIGRLEVGDHAIVNTTAVDLGLGTGGWHVVHWNLGAHQFTRPGPGHIMKLRYTSLQLDTGAAEERAPLPSSLDGLPIAVCSLHSQVPCVAVVLKHLVPTCRLTYLMTDSAALPLALSDVVVDLRACGLVDTTVTAGHSFGGDHEAVNTVSGLLVAAGHGADAIVVGPGPGVVGTGTPFGHSATDVAPIVDAVESLGGRAFVAIRYSSADSRERHRGVSHHMDSVVRLLRSDAPFVSPNASITAEFAQRFPQRRVLTVPTPDVGPLLSAHGLTVRTMGRDAGTDPGFFATAGAAGAALAHSLGGRVPGS